LASRDSVIMLMHFEPRVALYWHQINDASGNFMSALCCCILGLYTAVNADYELEGRSDICVGL